MGTEPVLDENSSTVDVMKAYNWYNYNYDNEDAKKFVLVYLKAKKVSKTTLKKVERIEPIKLRTIGWQCRIVTNGGALSKEAEQSMLQRLHDLIQKVVEPQVTNTQPVVVISIQERIENRASELIGDLEEQVDQFILHGESDFDVADWFRNKAIKPQVAKKIKDYYEPIYAEIFDAIKTSDPEIKRAYKHWSKPSIKAYLAFLKEILAVCDTQSLVIKATRKPRQKKIKPAGVLVSKLKYKQKNDKLTSIKPTEIVGAMQLWVFNDKTKTLSVFNAIGSGLSVKGSTITGFDEKTSVTKTVRKPDVVLPRVLEGGKIVLRKLMDELTTKEKAAKGRINTDTILLRAIK
jgi:hypothetical protein